MVGVVDRDAARRHLALANKHVSEGERRIDTQIALVARLERDGHDTFQAKSLLKQFENALCLQIETRNRIIEELAEGE